MIITVTLNAAIDKSLSVPSFQLGRRHRTVERRALAGGKGVNIARMLKTLGQPVIATGFQGGPTGTQIVAQLGEESILHDFVRIREESRTNTAVLDPTTGEQTEINEQGPTVGPEELEQFREKLLYLARGAAIVVFAGSLPRGIEPSFYAQLVRAMHKLDVMTIVDTDGEALRLAVRAEPDVVSPNVVEAEELVGHEFNDDTDHAGAVREIVSLGDHDGAGRLLGADAHRRLAARLPCHGAASGFGRGGRLRRRVSRRLHRRSLPRLLGGRVPELRRCLRRRVDRAPRRGADRRA
jgi:1-phosphofructokinase/tagatose 6-phosphate kinase